MNTSETTLRRLTHPRSVAVVGASATPGKVGYQVMKALSGAAARVIPVHPANTEILGAPVVNSIADLPADVDLAVVATGAETAVAAAEQCAARGIPFVVVLASGFSETGDEGRERENRLREIARQSGTRILGPNTLGFQMPESGADTVFVEHATETIAGGSTVLISQSGSVAIEALLSAARYGFGIRGFFGLGNKADLTEMDFLAHFAEDPACRCLAFYMEDLSAGRDFLNLARETVAKKPIIAIKAGRTDAGSKAASSHTGRLSGSDRVIDGALAGHLIQRVDDDEELCDAAKVLSLCPVAGGNRVAILSPAGGYGVMLADLVETPVRRTPLQMARLSEQTRTVLRERLLGFASVTNPVDLTAGVTDETYAAALEAVVADDGVDLVICVLFLAPPGLTPALTSRLASVIAASAKPVVVLAGDEDGTGAILRDLYEAGVAAFPSLARTAAAVRNLERRRIILSRVQAPGGTDAGALAIASARSRSGAASPAAGVAGPLHEKDAKDLIAGYGFRVPDSILVPGERGGQPVSTPSPAFPGPYVVKVCSAEVQHKTERGGVRLGVSAEDVPAAVTEMRERFGASAVLVEEMVAHDGIELIMGAFRDPELGPCVMIGAGGVLAELQQDVVFRLLPCSEADARQMLGELTVAPVFSGYRGMTCSADALVEAIVGVGRLVDDLGPRFRELDLNPVVCGRGGLVVLDAALVIES